VIIKSAGVSANVPALKGTLSDDYKKAPLGNDLISGRIAGTIGGIGAFTATVLPLTYAIRSKWASLKGKQGRLFLSNLVTNISTIMWNMGKYYFNASYPTTPAVILASIPLGTITEVSHAMSQRDLKFRAVGGVFLADQEGGEESLRIVGKAWGKNRFMFLQMLDILFLYGSSKAVDLFEDFLKNPYSFGLPNISDTDVSDLDKTISPWTDFNAGAHQEGIGIHRATFPVITRQKIYTNMFIETYEYTESVENGIDVVEYVIFLRKYIPPYPKNFAPIVKPSGSDFQVKWYYKDDVDDEIWNFVDRMSILMDYGLAAVMIMYRTIIYEMTGRYSFLENLVSRFGIALNRTIEGDLDSMRVNSDIWSVPEQEQVFGY